MTNAADVPCCNVAKPVQSDEAKPVEWNYLNRLVSNIAEYLPISDLFSLNGVNTHTHDIKQTNQQNFCNCVKHYGKESRGTLFMKLIANMVHYLGLARCGAALH